MESARRVWMVVFVFAAALAWPESIYLENGGATTGTIVEDAQGLVVVETSQGHPEVTKDSTDRNVHGGDDQTYYRERNGSLIWRPLPTLVGLLLLGVPEFVVEAQTAFSKHFAGTAILDFATVPGVCIFWGQVGPQYRPSGKYLHGVVLGAYPGIGVVAVAGFGSVIFFSGTLEAGYQWVFPRGFTLGLTGGVSGILANPYLGPVKPNLSAHFGYAFRDPLVKAR